MVSTFNAGSQLWYNTTHANPQFTQGKLGVSPDTSHRFLPPDFEACIAFLAERRLLLPVLLFLTGHRPFAFVAGQCLLFCLPFSMILWPGLPLRAWADFLSHPHGPA